MAPIVERRPGRRNLVFGLFAVGLIAAGSVLGVWPPRPILRRGTMAS